MEEKNKTYTAADFARYHAGTMPPGEMNALEKAALEDPFLEDALEGYVHSVDAEGDIKELKGRLAEKRKKKNVFFISAAAQNKWWRIAALFIVMAGAGYFFYRLNFINREKSIAKNETQSPAKKTDSAVAMKDEPKPNKMDDTVSNRDIAFENQQPLKSGERAKTALREAQSRAYKEMIPLSKQPAPPITVENYASTLKDSPKTFSASDKAVNTDSSSVAANEYTLKGKITDEAGNPVPYVNIMDKARHSGTVTDSAGYFLLRSKDSSITATAFAPGYENKSFSLKKDVQPSIAMNRTNGMMEEVVVTALGKRKHPKITARESEALDGKVSGVNIPGANLQPFPKNDRFGQYLKQNITPLYDENNDQVTGIVTLSFIINKKGRPRSIEVVKSTCKDCEDAAIRLLENGPDWIRKNDTPGTVDIKF